MKSYSRLVEIQRRLAGRVEPRGEPVVRRFGALDLAARENRGRAVAIVADREFELVETAVAEGLLRIPYIPGLLSFREAPLMIRAFRRLRVRPDVVLVDGQGLAHPRRFGLACHIGVLLNLPTIGCAKSLLVGEFRAPPNRRGGRSKLVHEGRQVGFALRTRPDVKPIFVSPGHRVSMDAVCDIVMSAVGEFRLPEPIRAADRLSKLFSGCVVSGRGKFPAGRPSF